MKYFFALWLIVYICSIIQYVIKLIDSKNAIEVVEDYLSSAEIISSGRISKNSNYSKCRNNLLFRYPRINKYLGIHFNSLNYGQGDEELYYNAIQIYNDLLMSRNYIFEDFLNSFNPLKSLKSIFSLPSSVAEWIGFDFNVSFSRIINLLGWIVAYIANLYSDEIKIFISSLFQ